MEKCYNWDKHLLAFKDKNDNIFRLQFRGNKTIVNGDSATGKSLMCKILSNYIKDRNTAFRVYDTSNIFILTFENKDKIFDQHNKLIIIDNAELVLDTELIEHINTDYNDNRYLIFLRKPMGIELSPNHFAELERVNGVIQLKYQFNTRGWF